MIMDIKSQKIIGDRIKAARNMRGVSQKELGKKIGLTQQGISFYEQGIRPIRIDTLLRIAEECEVPLHYFFIESAEMDNWISIMQRLPYELRTIVFEITKSLSKLEKYSDITEFLVPDYKD